MIWAGLALGMPLAALPPVIHASYAMYILTALLLAPPLIFIFLAKRGKELYIRRIPGIDAIEEAIGRATELGRPMMFSTGLTSINPLLYALLGILRYVARKAAAYGCRLICPQRDYEVLPIVEETVREAYRGEGRLDQFNPRDVRFLSLNQFAYASGYMGIAHREKVASCFLFGEFAAESLILAEAGQQIGAMQVAGTASYTQVPFFLTSCDYTIIGEEVYAAGAYLSREPSQLGSVRGQDVSKLVVLAMVFIGMIWATARVVAHQDYQEGWEYNIPLSRWLYVQPEQNRVLAKIEFADSFKPGSVPKRKDLELTLSSLRRKLARSGSNVVGKTIRLKTLAEEEEKNLSGKLDLFPAGAGRQEAEETVKQLKELAARLRSELEGDNDGKKTPEQLAYLIKHDLPTLEKVVREKARERTADYFQSEVESLIYWMDQQTGDKECASGGRVRKLVEAAEATRNNPTGTPSRIRRAVEIARRACYLKYFEQLRVQVREGREAASAAVPRFYFRTSQALEGVDPEKARALGGPTTLILDGSKSISGRGRPMYMEYTWKVSPEPYRDAPPQFKGAVSEVRFEKPGTYTVTLQVSERRTLKKLSSKEQAALDKAGKKNEIKPKRLVLSISGNDPSLVKYERIPAGRELAVSWRLPKNLVKGTQKIVYDFGEMGSDGKPVTFTVTADTPETDLIRKHAYEKPGDYRMTVLARYDVEEVAGAAVATGAGTSGATAKDDARLIVLRQRLGRALRQITDGLGDLNSDLAQLRGLAGAYGGVTARIKGAEEANWTDKQLAGKLATRIPGLMKFANEKANYLGPKAGAAEIFGSGRKPGEEGATGTGGRSGLKKKIVPVWKRYRVYWQVVEPNSDRVEKRVIIEEAPVRPRAPWMPALPKLKPKASSAAGKGGGT